MTPFARHVVDGMKRKRMTLRALCRDVGLDPSFLSKVLVGKRSPPAEEDVLRRIGQCLELDATELAVSAGRIPSAWRRLTSDPELFRRVNSIASENENRVPVRTESKGLSAEPRNPISTRSVLSTHASVLKRPDMGTELL